METLPVDPRSFWEKGYSAKLSAGWTSTYAHHHNHCVACITRLPSQSPDEKPDCRRHLISYRSAAIMYSIQSSYHPYLGLFLFLCCSGAVIVQFFKPTDLKRSAGRRKWAMPPGPSGPPVLGNLRQMMQARRGGALSFNAWVSWKPVERQHVPGSECAAAILLDSVW